jgi:hypothetical protein
VLPGPVATTIGATGAPKVAWVMERVRQAQPNEIAAAISWLVDLAPMR